MSRRYQEQRLSDLEVLREQQSDELERMRIARDESEALLREVYRALCGSPWFQRNHPQLDHRVSAHLHQRSRFIEEQQ